MSQVQLIAPATTAPKKRRLIRKVVSFAVDMSLWVVLLLIALNLWDFNTLPQHYCHGTIANVGGFCSLQNIKCVPMPAKCPDTWRGWIAENKFSFGNIVSPAWGDASVLGYIWMLMLVVGGSIFNIFLFIVFLIREPLLTSPVFLAVVSAIVDLTLERKAKPQKAEASETKSSFDPLNRAGRESPLGEAALARSGEVHAALLGGAPEHSPAPMFED